MKKTDKARGFGTVHPPRRRLLRTLLEVQGDVKTLFGESWPAPGDEQEPDAPNGSAPFPGPHRLWPLLQKDLERFRRQAESLQSFLAAQDLVAHWRVEEQGDIFVQGQRVFAARPPQGVQLSVEAAQVVSAFVAGRQLPEAKRKLIEKRLPAQGWAMEVFFALALAKKPFDPSITWVDVMGPTLDLIDAVSDALAVPVYQCKHHCDVRRPWQVVTDLPGGGGNFEAAIGSAYGQHFAPRHSSYPSGHATTAFAIAEVLTELTGTRFAARLNRMAALITSNRTLGGLHTPSDNDAGMQLGRELGRWMAHVAVHEQRVAPRFAVLFHLARENWLTTWH